MKKPRLEGVLLDALYDAPLEAKGWRSFLRMLEGSLRGGIAMLCMPAPACGERGVVVGSSLGEEFIASYCDVHFRTDPWLREANALAVGEVLVAEGWVGGQRLVETQFHRDWMEPQGLLADSMLGGVAERDPHRPASSIRVFQRAGAPLDGVAGEALLRELMPHLRRALRIHFASARGGAERDALAAALDHVSLGLIVVDRRQRVHATNRRADRLLAQRDGLVLDRDGLHAVRPDDELRLRQALDDAFDSSLGWSSKRVLRVERSSDPRALRVSVHRVPAREGVGLTSSLAVLFVSDPEAEVELPTDVLAKFHGLTSAESALVRELVNGRSLQEAALRLRITRGTARQRLAPIFEKTSTARQAALVRLMLTGPESLLGDE